MAKMPTPEQITEFIGGPDGPVVMCNILKLKRNAEGVVDPETFQEMMVYANGMRDYVQRNGAEFVFGGLIDSQLVGDGAQDFQIMSMMRYPSREVFLKLAGDPEIAATIGKNRDIALESQWLLAMTEFGAGTAQ